MKILDHLEATGALAGLCQLPRMGWRIGSINAILPETPMYWNALFIDLLFVISELSSYLPGES
jgi:hypothetical protein